MSPKTVPAAPLHPYLNALIEAVGYREAARRVGCTDVNLWYIRSGRTKRVRQETARGILLAAWPYSERARSRPPSVFDSRDCAVGGCGRPAEPGLNVCYSCAEYVAA